METLLLTAHILIAVAMIALILIQHGKGADAGVTFGGGGANTVFGGAGSGNFLSRSTAVLAALFFISSLGLAVIAKKKASNPFEISAPIAASGEVETTNTTQQPSNSAANKPAAQPVEKQSAPALSSPEPSSGTVN